LGYDFEVWGNSQMFAVRGSPSVRVKRCFIEVKGCAGAWDGTFHVSQNELYKRKMANKDSECYVIVAVAERHVLFWTLDPVNVLESII
jgi:hypothetical protein